MLVGQGQFIAKFLHNDDPDEYLTMWGYDVEFLGAAPDVAKAHAIYDEFAGVLSFMSDECHLVGVVMQEAVVGGTLEAVWDETQDGANDLAASPGNCAFLVHKYTDGFGTGRNGRAYLPGVIETKVGPAGTLDGAWQDAVSDTITLFMENIFDNESIRLVVNRGLRVDPLDPPPREPTVEPDPLFWTVLSVACDPVIGTQRRRIRR